MAPDPTDIVELTELATDREVPRIKEVLTAYIEVDGKQETAIARDFSEKGLYLQTPHISQAGKKIAIELEVGRESIWLEGMIISAQKSGNAKTEAFESGMGVLVETPPDAYLRLVEKFRGGEIPDSFRRGEERLELFHRIQFDSGGKFLTEYTRNLSRGGMHISLEKPLPPGTSIRAQLEIPGLKETVEVQGRVAYTLKPELSGDSAVRNSVGIQFVELSIDAREKLDAYLRRIAIFRRRFYQTSTRLVPGDGKLNDALLPEILLSFLARRSTGLLVIRNGSDEKRIYLKEGKPVYAESNQPGESLVDVLVQKGRLTPSDADISLKTHAKNDLHQGEILLRGGMIHAAELASSLVECHENLIINAFSWFDGEYHFQPMQSLRQEIAVLPLRTYQLIFAGIRKTYSNALIEAWTGFTDATTISRLAMPPSSAAVPPGVIRLLHHAATPKTLMQLSDELKTPMDVILPVSFAALVAGWISVESKQKMEQKSVSVASAPVSTVEKPGTQLSPTEEKILSEYNRLRSQTFQEMFDVSGPLHAALVTRKFMDRQRKYASLQQIRLSNPEVAEKLRELVLWHQTGYDVLRTPWLSRLYSRRVQALRMDPQRDVRMDVERRLFAAIIDLEQRKLAEALKRLEMIIQTHPSDPLILAYLAWVRFQLDPNAHQKEAADRLDQAMAEDSTNAELRFLRGKLHASQGNWGQAQKCFSSAVRIDPQMRKASAALERVSQRIANPKDL